MSQIKNAHISNENLNTEKQPKFKNTANFLRLNKIWSMETKCIHEY